MVKDLGQEQGQARTWHVALVLHLSRRWWVEAHCILWSAAAWTSIRWQRRLTGIALALGAECGRYSSSVGWTSGAICQTLRRGKEMFDFEIWCGSCRGAMACLPSNGGRYATESQWRKPREHL